MKTNLAACLFTLLLAGSIQAEVLPNDAVIDGKTIGEWSADWWNWMLTIPTNQNPALDTDGSRANVAQPDGSVFFLAKGFNINRRGARAFTVPEDKYLFVPLISNFQDNINVSPPYAVEELRDAARASIDLVNELHATIDGVAVPNLFGHRSITPVFSIFFESADNLDSFGTGQPIVGLDNPMVADGYYLIVEPLAPGTHIINFGATVGPPVNLTFDITDTITVLPIPLPEGMQKLIASVRDSRLATRQQQPLLASLNAGAMSFDAGNLRAGINQLHAFQNKIRAQLARGDEVLADQFTQAARKIMDQAMAQMH